MNNKKKEWYYADDESGQWIGPMAIENLDELHRDGKVEDFTYVLNTQMAKQEGPGAHGIPYSSISRLDVEFNPTLEEIYTTLVSKSTTVLSGPNNCGKTLLLKQLFSLVGQGGYLIGCNRFSHVDVLNTRQIDEHEHRRYYDNFIHNLYASNQNTENNDLQLQQIITTLKDRQRRKLFEICKQLIGSDFSLKRTDPENSFSPFYVDIDGENLRYSSTGTRLLLTLIGILLDERFTVLLVDEPEIGLSPRIQAVLARFLYDEKQRKEFCPHLKQLYIATHSHLFLDRKILSNNYILKKDMGTVSVKAVQSVSDFHHLQFDMLGNELESIFLPSAIVIVEGDSDVTYLTKIVKLHIPNRKVSIIRAGGDGEVQNKLNVLRETFGDFAMSPYCDRLFVVLDKKHSLNKERIKKQGVKHRHIFVWSKNGIEYFYPQDLLVSAFCCNPSELQSIKMESDPIEFNGIRKTKKELALFIAAQTTLKHSLNTELNSLIDSIKNACN